MDETKTVQITIPDDVAFADLKLARDPVTLDVSFDWAPIERICAARGSTLRCCARATRTTWPD